MGASSLRRSEMKSFNPSSRKAGHGRFQVNQVIFDPSAVYRLQKNAGEESNRIRGTKIEWTLPDPVDRSFQQPAARHQYSSTEFAEDPRLRSSSDGFSSLQESLLGASSDFGPKRREN